MTDREASLGDQAEVQDQEQRFAGLTGMESPGDLIELRPVSFSAKARQHGRHPTNAGRMEDADASASRAGWCGEVMEMYLRLDGDRIVEATFWADGCLSTMACGDMLTTMVRGLSLEAATTISPEELINALDGLPYKSQHCAELSVETLRDAIDSRTGEG